MIRLQEPELQAIDDRAAWRAAWTDDERTLAHTPPGYWQSLVDISQIKRVLLSGLDPDLRLKFLEQLDARVFGILPLEAMRRVEPACDTAMEMLGEMRVLSFDDKARLMRKWNVMAMFCNLNPSIVDALKLFAGVNSAGEVVA